MRMELVIRFDYGSIVPWVRDDDGSRRRSPGPDTLHLRTPVELRGGTSGRCAEFTVARGRAGAVRPDVAPVARAAARAGRRRGGARARPTGGGGNGRTRCTATGEWREAVKRSLITLKALTYAPTGGIVAAPTTSLPEQIGGVRNWDYRYCWLRDATLTLLALLNAGYTDEARAWRDWLLRAVAGPPDELQIMYGLGGERRLTELELPGCRVRGLAAGPDRQRRLDQLQLDVYGEVMDVLYQCRDGRARRRRTTRWRLRRRTCSSWLESDVAASPTRASGRSAARGGTSPTRR